MSDSSLSILSVLAAILLILFVIDADEWWSNNNTIYYTSCYTDKDITFDQCPDKQKQWVSITYTAIPEAQKVMTNVTFPMSAGKCDVIDRNNWSCDRNGLLIIMDNGEYKAMHTDDFKSADDLTVYYSKWRWLMKGGYKAIKSLY